MAQRRRRGVGRACAAGDRALGRERIVERQATSGVTRALTSKHVTSRSRSQHARALRRRKLGLSA